jgi:hypothetical protein
MMKPNNDIQVEDSPMADEPKTPETVLPPEPAKQKGFIDRAQPWIIVSLVALFVGAAAVFFALYLPKVSELNSSKADLAQSTEKLAAAEIDLTATKTDAASLQNALDAKTAELTKSNQMVLIYKFQADLHAARVAILVLDPASALQALNFVKLDLEDLKGTSLDPTALSGFEARIAEAEANLKATPQKSLSALNTINTNLLLLLNNLK